MAVGEEVEAGVWEYVGGGWGGGGDCSVGVRRWRSGRRWRLQCGST